jgi:hypothetical protein
MRSRATLILIAVCSVLALIAYFLFPCPPKGAPESDLASALARLQQHPADWVAASIITEYALDSRSPQRFALWRGAHNYAHGLAPWRANPEIGFVRSGLFHWYELPPADRSAVIAAATPLLRDAGAFGELYAPLFQLTGNMALLRRTNPGTLNALTQLEELAATYGMYDDYRSLREEARRKRLEDFALTRTTLLPTELATALPEHLEVADDPLLLAVLDEAHRRPLEGPPARSIDGLIDFAIRHDLGPLDGFEAVVAEQSVPDFTRARLALRLERTDQATEIEQRTPAIGVDWQQYHIERAEFDSARHDHRASSIQLMKAMLAGRSAEVLAASWHIDHDSLAADELTRRFGSLSEWQGLCGTDLCTSATARIYALSPVSVSLVLEAVQSDERPPYVELFLDDRRAAEAPVDGKTELRIDIPTSGLHRVALRLANPRTRNMMQRRVRIVP